MEEVKGGVLITPKDIQLITGCTLNSAQKEHKAVRDALGKKSTKRLTVVEYCKYYEFNLEEIVAYINKYR